MKTGLAMLVGLLIVAAIIIIYTLRNKNVAASQNKINKFGGKNSFSRSRKEANAKSNSGANKRTV